MQFLGIQMQLCVCVCVCVCADAVSRSWLPVRNPQGFMSASSRSVCSHSHLPNDRAHACRDARLEQGLVLSDEDTQALQPCDDVANHWRQVQRALEVCKAEVKQAAEADDVKPLAELSIDAGDMWVYLQLAKRVASIQSTRAQGAPCVGICAPTGAGKSTLTQLLKALLERVLSVGRVIEVSLDDFLSSQHERRERGVQTRWDIHSTNEDFAHLLSDLKQANDTSSVVQLPMFSKGRDERLLTSRKVTGPVAVVLFEGWRIGVNHPNFL